jgi:acyl-coenzyme A synthetase/AMP-(fatty) acid ligase
MFMPVYCDEQTKRQGPARHDVCGADHAKPASAISKNTHPNPGVREAAVIGRPDADWGEEVVAFVALHPRTDVRAEELDRQCIAAIARFKRPEHYIFVDELPKNVNGKVVKRDLRKYHNE